MQNNALSFSRVQTQSKYMYQNTGIAEMPMGKMEVGKELGMKEKNKKRKDLYRSMMATTH